MADVVRKKLNNGVEIPVLGLGVWESGDKTVPAVKTALEYGYRHIDTAKAYGNEALVAEGIKESGIPRSEVFITTKLWNDDQRAHKQREVIEESLKKLDTDYIDLYLIHWPVAEVFVESWKIMEEYYKKGVFRAIGVSNFNKKQMSELLKSADIVPAVNQIELSPYLSQYELTDYLDEKGIAVECWSPLARGKVFGDEILTIIAGKYGRTISQIVLRWQIQRGLITIPKSVHKERIIENGDIFDFELSPDDMQAINNLNRNEHIMPGVDPETFDF